MKRIQLLAILAVLVVFAGRSFAGSSNPGPVTFKITATFQAINGQSTSKTNASSTSTNITVTTSFTESNSVIDDTALLTMLANSFNTTFPPSAQLKFNAISNSFVVVNGTNVILDVSSVFTFIISDGAVTAGTIVTGVQFNNAGETVKTTEKFSQLVSAKLNYDDSTRATANGKATRLVINGVESFKTSTLVTTNVNFTDSISYTGAGQGSISNNVANTTFILRGGFTTATGGTAPLLE